MEKCYAVWANGRIITDGQGQPFNLEQARRVAVQYENAEVVEIHQYQPLFDFASPSLLRHGDWLSNGFALTRAYKVELADYPKIGELLATLKGQRPMKLRLLATCPPPNEFSLDAPLRIFAPANLRRPYRWQIKNLICASERYLKQIDEDWAMRYVGAITGLVTISDDGDLIGACASIRAQDDRLDRLRDLIDAALGNTDW